MYYFFYSLNSNNFHHLIIWALTTTTNSDGHQSMIQNRQLTDRYSFVALVPNLKSMKISMYLSSQRVFYVIVNLKVLFFFGESMLYNWIKIIRSIEWMNEFISNWDLGHKQDKRSIIGISKVGLADKYLFYQWNQFNFFFE